MDLVVPGLLTLLLIGGGTASVLIALRLAPRSRSGGGDDGRGLLRLTAEVHTGWEQTIIGLLHELGLPRSTEGLRYGQLYVETGTEHLLRVRSRSEIARGFLGAIEVRPARRLTAVTYTIVRLPPDDDLQWRVLDLELELVAALRRIDRHVDLQLSAGTLRELQRAQSAGEERPS